MPVSDAVSAPSATNEPVFNARAGTWFLVPSPGTNEDNLQLVADLIRVLKADTRVLQVIPPELNEHWTQRVTVFPDAERSPTPDGVLTGRDQFKILELSSAIRFEVRVPMKNQKAHHGAEDIPSDTYWVAWNGVSIFVMWKQEDDSWFPISGGHIVEEVLRDVLEQIGCGLYVQACGPRCDYGFLHTGIRVSTDPNVDDFTLTEGTDGRTVDYASFAELANPLEGLEFLAMSLSSGLGGFATFKNSGRRIIDIEDALRSDLSHLLFHYHEHTVLVASGRAPMALYNRWKARKWRKEAWSLISSIWLGMANIETMRRSWENERRSMLSEREILPLLQGDSRRDEETIDALETDPIAETVNQVAAALNNRMAVTATLWGALAGGLAGGAAAAIGSGGG